MASTKKCLPRIIATRRSCSPTRPGRPAEVSEAVLARRAAPHDVEVVLEHQALRGRHRRLRLVAVGALGEREEARDPRHDLLLDRVSLGAAGATAPVARGLRSGARRHPGGSRVDPEARACVAEGGAVRGLADLAEDLVDVLVRHLVLQHLDDDAPRLLDHQGARDLQRPRVGNPPPERRAPGHELEGRRDQRTPEVRLVELPPRGSQLAHERGLERCSERRVQRSVGAGTGSAAIHHVWKA